MRTNNKHCLLLLLLFLIRLTFPAYAQNPEWTQIAPGVWKSVIGSPDKLDLFSAAEVKPNIDGLLRIDKADFPLSRNEITAGIVSEKTYLRFPLLKGEQIFGFGLNFKTVHQRGKILQLHVDHYGGTDNGRTHAPVPFYVSDHGYGVFINSARYLTVYAGSGVRKDSPEAPEERDRNTDKKWTSRPYSDAVEIVVPAGGVEIYVFAGPTPMDAVRRFNLFSGGGCLPPRWGLGFTQRVPTLYTSAQVETGSRIICRERISPRFYRTRARLAEQGLPVYFRMGHIKISLILPSFVRTMKEKGIHLNLWTNPYVSSHSPIYNEILPFTGTHTVWGGVVPDLTMRDAKEIIISQLQKSQVNIGISGYKIDECDGYDYWLWPDVAKFPSGNSAEQMRQTYGLLLQNITTQILQAEEQKDLWTCPCFKRRRGIIPLCDLQRLLQS